MEMRIRLYFRFVDYINLYGKHFHGIEKSTFTTPNLNIVSDAMALGLNIFIFFNRMKIEFP